MNKTVTPEHGGTYALRSKNYIATGCSEQSRIHFSKESTDGDAYLRAILSNRANSCPAEAPPQNGKEILGTKAVNPAPSPLDIQIAGDHYKSLKIQPIEYIQANQLGYEEGNVVKYVTRWESKGGRKDLEKAIHYLQLLLASPRAQK